MASFKQILKNTLIQVVLRLTNPSGVGLSADVGIVTYADTGVTNKIDEFAGTHKFDIQKVKPASLTLGLSQPLASAGGTWTFDYQPSVTLTAGTTSYIKIRFDKNLFSYDGLGISCDSYADNSNLGAADTVSAVYDADTGTSTITLDNTKNYQSSTVTARLILRSSATGIINPILPGQYPVIFETYKDQAVTIQDIQTVFVTITPNIFSPVPVITPIFYHENQKSIYKFKLQMPNEAFPSGLLQNTFQKDRSFFQIEFHPADTGGNLQFENDLGLGVVSTTPCYAISGIQFSIFEILDPYHTSKIKY